MSDDEEEKPFRRLKKGSEQPKDQSDSPRDAIRKYCLTKLQEILKPIFLQFAKRGDTSTEVMELDEEEERVCEEKTISYCQELEKCLYETYGEIDKNGHKAAVGKYKYVFFCYDLEYQKND